MSKELQDAMKDAASGRMVQVDLSFGRKHTGTADGFYARGNDIICIVTVNGQTMERSSGSWRFV